MGVLEDLKIHHREKKNENVFDIMQGVSIAFFIKNEEKKGVKIFYQDQWGKRDEKYDYLSKNHIYNKNMKDFQIIKKI